VSRHCRSARNVAASECPHHSVFHEILENAPVAITIVRAPDFVYELVNPAFEALVGGEESLGRRVADVWGEAAAPLIADLEQVIATGRPQESVDVPLAIRRSPGGAPENIHATMIRVPLLGPDGKPDRVLTMGFETTEAVRQRRVVDETLARDEAIMANLQEGLLIADPTGRVISANPAALKVHGWNRAAEALRKLSDFGEFRVETLDGESVPVGEWPLARVLRGETLRNIELVVSRLDTGETRIISYSGSPISSGGGRIGFAVLTMRDISEQKEAERKLRESERHFRELADSMPHLVWISRPDGYHVYFNRRWYEELGIDAGQSLGEGWREHLHPDDRERSSRLWRHSLATGEDYHIEYRFLTARGEYRWYLGRAVPARDNQGRIVQGRIVRWYGTCTDIHDRKREEERQRQTQKLESIGLLAGGVAHDFNNLLTGIMGNASLALEDTGPAAEEKIRRILDAAERAAHLTRQLLAYSGKGKFFVADLDLSQSVRDMLDLLRLSVPKSIDIKLDLGEGLPLVSSDPGQLQQLVMNLVINASEAIGEGSPGLITISTGVGEIGPGFAGALEEEIEAGRYTWLQVTDTGSGMDEEVRTKIFDPFFSTKFTGRGLGLAAVAGIMRSLKGTVDVRSEPRQGTVFTLYFPAGRAAPAPARETRGTILIVDDEPEVRHFIAAVLECAKFQILTADNGEHGLEVFDAHCDEIDAMIVDLIMPVMSGNQLLANIRARAPRMKVLVTSGCAEAEARRLCSSLHGAAFLQKPYTAKRLRESVERLLHDAPAAAAGD
jgi:PAS domain S-box-containing protein